MFGQPLQLAMVQRRFDTDLNANTARPSVVDVARTLTKQKYQQAVHECASSTEGSDTRLVMEVWRERDVVS